MKPAETKRRQMRPMFQKDSFWQHAEPRHTDRNKDHGPLSLHKLGEGLRRVMGMRGRDRRYLATSEPATSQRRGARRLSTSEVCPSFNPGLPHSPYFTYTLGY